ncbi:succinate dehydrogenase, hydrophobic membrane anchor protein [Vibrio sp. SS-MA-C1-2]|uniref:succinate dehydrogenase, hydrophobic membrane anchor protein n=1 Tax=Vibrio sp. SS-MA-C1-2 TaxID=2908646 RepID=UPI001F41E798|nr:succinate dehydrogenase, hydrophobic membrane anchor protein [Vibrio sp. SS-MA-C1-2]UJF18656.1 succinate dehydrogenase, hydrophobic membrane anchor protein [Vibrio sp. SS-MA-C1-2]
MVKNITALGRNGVHDFILIRVSALVILFYLLYMTGFFMFGPEITYHSWKTFFSQLTTQVFTLLALAALFIHGWIGMWQVFTDYIKSSLLRGLLLAGSVVLLAIYLLSGFSILWGM